MNYLKIVIINKDIILEASPSTAGGVFITMDNLNSDENSIDMVLETKDVIELIKALQKYTEPF